MFDLVCDVVIRGIGLGRCCRVDSSPPMLETLAGIAIALEIE